MKRGDEEGVVDGLDEEARFAVVCASRPGCLLRPARARGWLLLPAQPSLDCPLSFPLARVAATSEPSTLDQDSIRAAAAGLAEQPSQPRARTQVESFEQPSLPSFPCHPHPPNFIVNMVSIARKTTRHDTTMTAAMLARIESRQTMRCDAMQTRLDEKMELGLEEG